MPTQIPTPLTIGAQQSPLEREIIWEGTAISNSKTLPLLSQIADQSCSEINSLNNQKIPKPPTDSYNAICKTCLAIPKGMH